MQKPEKAFYLLRRKGRAQHTHGIIVAELRRVSTSMYPSVNSARPLVTITAPRLRQPIEVLALLYKGVSALLIYLAFFIGDNTPAKGNDLV